MATQIKTALTPSLEICYEQTGPDSGDPILLLHGFPYDIRQYDKVRDALATPERRIVVPYLRGFGPTRYRNQGIFRSGQQAALGNDVVELMDALGIERAVVCGYDWGGRAGCVAAALWPKRISGLVSASAYAIQDIKKSALSPVPPQTAYELWYQSYFNTPQGQLGLEQERDEFCRFLWHLWSPSWKFTDAEYTRTAASFQNPDFVTTAVHSYRHRYANAPGDPALEDLEARLAKQPKIGAPTVVLHGAEDQVEPPQTTDGKEPHFTGLYRRAILSDVGHCLPAEAPMEVTRAIEALLVSGKCCGLPT